MFSGNEQLVLHFLFAFFFNGFNAFAYLFFFTLLFIIIFFCCFRIEFELPEAAKKLIEDEVKEAKAREEAIKKAKEKEEAKAAEKEEEEKKDEENKEEL